MNHDTHAAIVRLLWTWFLIGVSQMTPLQVVQAIAALAATIYTILQTCVLVSSWFERRRGP